MKVHPQFIQENGHPAFVVLPLDEYESILSCLEEIGDIEAVVTAQDDDSELFPLELVEKIASGESPIKVFREYRKMSQANLAKKVGISRQYISQIESLERSGSMMTLKRIAKALNVRLDDLTVETK